jgi:V/A-type H+-transporting ATPase subunit I
MSKVSVTGARRVMDDVIEATHEQHLLHVTEYDGSWAGFEPGTPVEGADEASDKLVTVRSLESILDVEEADAGPTRVIDDEEIESELASVRERVNELDDRRDELRDELRTVEEQVETAEPFVELGIDLDLLRGYDSLQVAVGEGRRDAVERAVVDADDLRQYELFGEDGAVFAVFARPQEGAPVDALSDALVGTDFAGLEVPDAEGSPESYVRTLETERDRLAEEIAEVENELEAVKTEAAGFLLAAEERLSIDVQKTEAPLAFATTENAFVAEGWIPSEEYTTFATAVSDAADGHVEVEELERASFGSDGTEKLREEVSGDAGGQPAATDGDPKARADGGARRTAADGGNVVMRNDDPPVVQDNPAVVEPFEVIVKAVGLPKYREFDPTALLFLTFPAFFGFMIGDLGYGVVYTGIGYYLYANFDSPAFKSMGGVTIFAGVFTAVFGVLYGEIFGLHLITEYVWHGLFGMGHSPLRKGLMPGALRWAQGWLVVSLLVGILHLNVGWVIDFVENVELHDAKHAVYESGSWLLMMNGLWVWVFSDAVRGTAPAFLYETFSSDGIVPLGFSGFPAMELFTIPGVGAITLPLLVFFVGLGLLAAGEPAELPEFLNVLVNVLSYTRLAAVLLAKAGMAFTVNLLFFGAYQHEGEFHFLLTYGPESVEHGTILFEGLIHGGAPLVLVGLVVLVLGHALVLALGVTSAGLQAVRLEYVEFFGKFYEGGGKSYEPFGYERRYTAEK